MDVLLWQIGVLLAAMVFGSVSVDEIGLIDCCAMGCW